MRWLILALLFFSRAGLGLQFQSLGSVDDHLITAFGFDYTEIGTLIGMFMLPGLVLALPTGFLGRYLSDRVVVGSGLGLLAAGGLVATAAEGFGVLAVGRMTCGAGFVLASIFMTKMVADWFAGREIATAMGIVVMSWPFGIAIGQIGHEWLAAEYGWPMAFIAASSYCGIGAMAIFALYRSPQHSSTNAPVNTPGNRSLLTRNETILTVLASFVWAFFNAAFVVYLSFAPLLLTTSGYAPLQAATTVSIASWVMIVSGALCGQVADRTRKPDIVLYVCLATAMGALALLRQTDLAVPLIFVFGLIGMSPAGVIMALTSEAMGPDKRAFGMGVFFSSYFLVVAPAPAIAGWLYDRSNDPYHPILFAIALLGLVALSNVVFRVAQRIVGPLH